MEENQPICFLRRNFGNRGYRFVDNYPLVKLVHPSSITIVTEHLTDKSFEDVRSIVEAKAQTTYPGLTHCPVYQDTAVNFYFPDVPSHIKKNL